MKTVLEELRNELKANANEQARISGERFFKEPVRMYGMKAAVLSKIARDHYNNVKDLQKNEIWSMCGELWQSGFFEESIVACVWSHKMKRQFKPDDFKVFERWVKSYITNWASCDTFCNHTVGTFVEMYPAFLKELKKWATSGNRWVKRAAAVSLIVPAKKGMWLDDVFEIATLLLHDNDDMVQKGYGWMLKVAASKHEKEVFDFVCRYKATMPRTALRYAIEKMPVDMRKKAMEKK
jgi:3-methyladenine DNA glycosylase AlkD